MAERSSKESIKASEPAWKPDARAVPWPGGLYHAISDKHTQSFTTGRTQKRNWYAKYVPPASSLPCASSVTSTHTAALLPSHLQHQSATALMLGYQHQASHFPEACPCPPRATWPVLGGTSGPNDLSNWVSAPEISPAAVHFFKQELYSFENVKTLEETR